MIIHKNTFLEAEKILKKILNSKDSANLLLRNFFLEFSHIGKKDRKIISELIFYVLRNKILLEKISPCKSSKTFLIISLIKLYNFSNEKLKNLVEGKELLKLDFDIESKINKCSDKDKLSIPNWLWNKINLIFDKDEAINFARSLMFNASLDLRVNTLVTNRKKIISILKSKKIDCLPTPYSPFGIRLKNKINIKNDPLFLNGSLEIQDEGSQLITFLLSPKREESIIDFCAGSGGKSLLIGSMMKNTGRIYAFDVNKKRLDAIKERIRRSKLTNIHPILISSENDYKLTRFHGKIDKIFIDAPCSGLGTLRRNPDLKWQITLESLNALKVKQLSILDSAKHMLKTGGKLVYATCSFLMEENELIIKDFLNHNSNFRFETDENFSKEISIFLNNGMIRTFTHKHECDSFFATSLIKI